MKCPICGAELEIVICDDEGNDHCEEYENDPYSGLTFSLQHPYTAKECILKGKYHDNLYDSREELKHHYNYVCNIINKMSKNISQEDFKEAIMFMGEWYL